MSGIRFIRHKLHASSDVGFVSHQRVLGAYCDWKGTLRTLPDKLHGIVETELPKVVSGSVPG
jgi:hypothetical protein